MPGKRATSGNERGATLLGLIVGSTLFLILLGGAWEVFRTTSSSSSSSLKLNQLNQDSQRAMDRIVSQLMPAGSSTINPDPAPPIGVQGLRFRHTAGIVAGVVQWQPEKSIEFRQAANDPDDGVDNDGDGLIDEGEIVLVTNVGLLNERTDILATGVLEYLKGELPNAADDNGNGLIDERGLTFVRRDGALLVTFSLGARSPSGPGIVARTLTSTISFRN